MPNPKHRPLRLADPAAPVPDTRASVARALLDRWFPVDPPRSDQALTMLNPDWRTSENLEKLETDPRYLIGRLQQALTALLAARCRRWTRRRSCSSRPSPTPSATRRRTCHKCPPDGSGICAKCWPDWRQASACEALWSELGIVADGPRRKPRLRVAGDAR